MVKIVGKKIATLPITDTKSVKIGNDKRQFIIRIPVKISQQTILKKYENDYTAKISVDINNPTKIIIELTDNGRKPKSF